MKGVIGVTCFIGLLLLLTGCVPDPKRAAEGYAISVAAEQEAKNAEQKRAFEAELHALEVENQRAAQAEWQSGMMRVFRTGATVLQGLIVVLGVMGAWGLWGTTKAYNDYAWRRASVLADQIKLDARTHTFPILPVRVGKDIVALVNPNDNSVLLFDEKNEADRAKVQAMANVLFAGELGHQARLSHRPGEVASIPATQIIEGE